MKYMHELASSMGIQVIHVDADLPGELIDLPTCDLCGREQKYLYPMYCTEVDPTHVDYMVCRVCLNGRADEYERSEEDGIDSVPF